jgi:hypothetical protein
LNLAWEAETGQATFPAPFSALTASSRLQHLDLSCNYMPPGVWTHMFVEGRSLPHLRVLNLGYLRNSARKAASFLHSNWKRMFEQTKDLAPLQASRLVSCCPGLQELDLMDWAYYPELLAPLQGLSSLTRLVTGSRSADPRALGAVVHHLTGLRDLEVWMPQAKASPEELWQLTQLQELTRLSYMYCGGRVDLEQVSAA